MADPGFPRGGGVNSPGGESPTYDFAKFSQKLHEIVRIWTPGAGGARPKFYYVDPPLNIVICFHLLMKNIELNSYDVVCLFKSFGKLKFDLNL